VEIVDHTPSISKAAPDKGSHLGEAGLAMAENFLASTPPTTVRQAWAGINGDPGEERGRGLALVWLWFCGLVRALALTSLYGLALALSTRRRTGGAMIICGLLVAVFCITRALLP
jgi:hypothetical protein